MIPILFDKDETLFASNGLGRLTECTRCEVTEERNGIYECEFDYPATGKLFSELAEGRYIFTTHDESKIPQAFQIYYKSAPLEGVVTFRAWHISYLLNNVIVGPFTAASCAAAIAAIPGASITENPFTFFTDKQVSSPYTLRVPTAARAILGGSENSLLDVYGKGEYEFNMFSVTLKTNRGTNRGVSIRYGKNLTSLEQERDASEIYDGVVPYWQSSSEDDDTVVTLDHPVYRTGTDSGRVVAMDFSEDFEEAPTVQALEARAQSYIDGADTFEIRENIRIDFVQLWQTEEYKNVANLQRIYLCDTVNIFYERLGINATAKCIKTTYDSLRERYTAMELGTARTTLAQQILETASESIMKNVPSKTAMQSAIDRATQLISGGFGGFIKYNYLSDGTPSEMLIMNTASESTATNIIRLNQNGIGFSTDGGTTYRNAWTIDGHLNADFIDTGTLNASLIKAGILQSQDGASPSFYLDLVNGILRGKFSELSISGQSVSDIADDVLSDFVDNQYAQDLADLQSQIDGQIETYFDSYVPTMTNAPANTWTTDAEKDAHLGDLFYVVDDPDHGGETYRFAKIDGVYQWQLVEDSAVAAALEKATQAYALAGNKKRVFTATPTTPYDKGDLWVNGTDIKYCKTARASGSYRAADWGLASNYIDMADAETAAANAVSAFQDGTFATFVTQTNNSLAIKITTFYQASAPTANVTGDLWIDTANGNTLHRWDGSQWTDVQDADIQAAVAAAAGAQATADGKIKTYAQDTAPENTAADPLDLGDLWIDTNNNNRLYRWNGEEWEDVADYSALRSFINNTYNRDIEALRAADDAQIETWYRASDPAEEWLTAEDKQKHVGDLWYKTTDQTTWRYNGTAWEQQNAPKAVFDKIDGKAQVFVAQPVPPYDRGDMWTNGTDLYVCRTARASGSYTASDWELATDYIDQAAAEAAASGAVSAFQNGAYAAFVTQTNSALSQKITTFYQASAPTANVVGDLWIDTDDKNKLYRWNGSSWVDVQDAGIQEAIAAAGDAQSTADGKIKTYAQTTQPAGTAADPLDVGDLWIKTNSNNRLYRYNGSSWVAVTDTYQLNAFRNGAYATFVTQTNNSLAIKITTFYQASAPTANVVGDLWIDTDDKNKLYRWNGSSWVNVQDAGIREALVAAGDAQATADGKIKTYAQAGLPSVQDPDVGDLWINTADNNHLYRYNGSSWVAVTDTSQLNTFLNGTYATDLAALRAADDLKAETWYQSTDPATNWSAADKTKHKGDLWYKTTNQTTWRYTGSAWEQLNVPTAVFDEIDGRAQIFVAQPVPPYAIGDMWTNGSDLYVCRTPKGEGQGYAAADWRLATNYIDQADAENAAENAVGNYDTALNQQAVFNKLTNNEADQGVYLDGTKLYINASMIKAGRLVGREIDNGNGTFSVSSAGVMYALSGNIAGWGFNYQEMKKAVRGTDGYVYKVIFQPPLASGAVTPVLACQKSRTQGDPTDTSLVFDTILALYSDGSAKFGSTSLNQGGTLTFTASNGKQYRISNEGFAEWTPVGNNQYGKTVSLGPDGFEINDSNGAWRMRLNNSELSFSASEYSSGGRALLEYDFSDYDGQNGYIVFDNGLAMCWQQVTVTVPVNSSWGSWYESPEINLGPMPYEFAYAPTVTATVRGASRFALCEGVIGTTIDEWGSTYLCRATSATSQTYTINLIAIGAAAR